MKKKTRILASLLVVLILVTAILPTSVFADSTTKITKSNAINSDYYYWGGQMMIIPSTHRLRITICCSAFAQLMNCRRKRKKKWNIAP